MKLKTAYRPKKPEAQPPELPVDLPTVETSTPEALDVSVLSVDIPSEGEPEIVAALQTSTQADEAAEALKRQIAAVHEAEQSQRQNNAQYVPPEMQRPLSREEKLDLWRSQGLTAKEADFLREHPLMIDFPQVSAYAANEALQSGIERRGQPRNAATIHGSRPLIGIVSDVFGAGVKHHVT